MRKSQWQEPSTRLAPSLWALGIQPGHVGPKAWPVGVVPGAALRGPTAPPPSPLGDPGRDRSLWSSVSLPSCSLLLQQKREERESKPCLAECWDLEFREEAQAFL